MLQKYQNKKDMKQILQRVKLRIDCSSGSSEQDENQDKAHEPSGSKKHQKQNGQNGVGTSNYYYSQEVFILITKLTYLLGSELKAEIVNWNY